METINLLPDEIYEEFTFHLEEPVETTTWRELQHEREDFFAWASRMLRFKVMAGAKIHGDVFEGDPLDHAIEEALDLMFYLWMEKQKQAAR